nr:hypothetical protein [uncultured Sulfurimonas sp.]
MQRKNNILMLCKSTSRGDRNNLMNNSQRTKTHKNAMAMMMAIIVLVVISTIMALSLTLTTQTAKRTTDLYLYEQSALLAHSASEYAMLRISQVAPCEQENFSFTHDGIYNIDVSLQYVYTSPSPCLTAVAPHGVDYNNSTINYPDTNGTVLMDISVTTNQGTEPIRYFRRSIQKL